MDKNTWQQSRLFPFHHQKHVSACKCALESFTRGSNLAPWVIFVRVNLQCTLASYWWNVWTSQSCAFTLTSKTFVGMDQNILSPFESTLPLITKLKQPRKKKRTMVCVCVWAGGWVDGWVEGWIMHISCNFLWISSSFYCSGMKWNQHLSAKKRKRKEKHNSICLSSSCHCPVHTQSAIFDQTYVHRTCETTGNKQALQKQCYVKPRCVIKPTIRLR